jgi:hypothetical protein
MLDALSFLDPDSGIDGDGGCAERADHKGIDVHFLIFIQTSITVIFLESAVQRQRYKSATSYSS